MNKRRTKWNVIVVEKFNSVRAIACDRDRVVVIIDHCYNPKCMSISTKQTQSSSPKSKATLSPLFGGLEGKDNFGIAFSSKSIWIRQGERNNCWVSKYSWNGVDQGELQIYSSNQNEANDDITPFIMLKKKLYKITKSGLESFFGFSGITWQENSHDSIAYDGSSVYGTFEGKLWKVSTSSPPTFQYLDIPELSGMYLLGLCYNEGFLYITEGRPSSVWRISIRSLSPQLLIGKNAFVDDHVFLGPPHFDYIAVNNQGWLFVGCFRGLWMLQSDQVPWNVARILWIGLLKNQPSDCFIAKLPKDILRDILSLL